VDRWRQRRVPGWRRRQPGDGGGQVDSGAQVGGVQWRVGSRATVVGMSAALHRWVAAVGSWVAARRWVAVGSCGSPRVGRNKVTVAVLSL
jgi:hypothetical protein